MARALFVLNVDVEQRRRRQRQRGARHLALDRVPRDCRAHEQREGDESAYKPDPAWGYTGHPYAHRYDAGEEDLSMASRISRRRAQSIERRFSTSPYAHSIAKGVLALGDGVEPPPGYDANKCGWAGFPPTGLTPM